MMGFLFSCAILGTCYGFIASILGDAINLPIAKIFILGACLSVIHATHLWLVTTSKESGDDE